jgi:hypothetical protein
MLDYFHRQAVTATAEPSVTIFGDDHAIWEGPSSDGTPATSWA